MNAEPYLLAVISGTMVPVVVERKDAAGALAAASTTLAGFSLVFLGLLVTRPLEAVRMFRLKFKIIAGLLAVFWLDLLSAGCALAWLYLKAPGTIRIPVLSTTGAAGFLYQAGWGLFWFTALVSFYVVIAVMTVLLETLRNGRGQEKT